MQQLAKKLKKLLKNESIVDLIIFGSEVKGRMNAKDIDIAIIIRKEISRYEIKKQIETSLGAKIDLTVVSIEEYDKFIWLTLLKEGFSVKHNKPLYEVQGTSPIKLYKYSLKQMTNSQKVMFDRGIKNFKDIKKLSNRVVLVPIKKTAEFEDFLKLWGLDIETEEYELLPVVRKEEI